MWLFKKRRVPMVGIDISSSVVKLIQFGLHDKRYRVEHYGVQRLPENAVSERRIVNVQEVGQAIKKAVERSGTRAKFAAVAVPPAAAIVREIILPMGLSDDEMEGEIQSRADEYLPFPIDQVYLDFQVLEGLADDGKSLKGLLVASHKEHVDLRREALEVGGLIAKVVDAETYAVERAFSLISDQLPEESVQKVVAIVDIGATTTTVNVLHDGRLIFIKEQLFGGKELTEEIQKHFGTSYEDAGMAKKRGGLPSNYVSEVLNPFKEKMVIQINQSLRAFFNSTQSTQEGVDVIVLSGGNASIPEINEFIEDKTKIKTVIANPFASVSLAHRIDSKALTDDAPALMIACGLALRSFD